MCWILCWTGIRMSCKNMGKLRCWVFYFWFCCKWERSRKEEISYLDFFALYDWSTFSFSPVALPCIKKLCFYLLPSNWLEESNSFLPIIQANILGLILTFFFPSGAHSVNQQIWTLLWRPTWILTTFYRSPVLWPSPSYYHALPTIVSSLASLIPFLSCRNFASQNIQ